MADENPASVPVREGRKRSEAGEGGARPARRLGERCPAEEPANRRREPPGHTAQRVVYGPSSAFRPLFSPSDGEGTSLAKMSLAPSRRPRQPRRASVALSGRRLMLPNTLGWITFLVTSVRRPRKEAGRNDHPSDGTVRQGMTELRRTASWRGWTNERKGKNVCRKRKHGSSVSWKRDDRPVTNQFGQA